MATRIQIRRDTAANWASVNPILANGEIGLETDTTTPTLKMGDGVTRWNELPYYMAEGGAKGTLTAADIPDLDWSKITSGKPTTLSGYGISNGVTSNSSITSGTKPKISYDAKGLVTGGSDLSASDVPSLDWSKITTGKPTTISGYGITDSYVHPSSHPASMIEESNSKMFVSYSDKSKWDAYAIISQLSSAYSGCYAKFPDGTLIQWQWINNVPKNAVTTYTLPIAFYDTGDSNWYYTVFTNYCGDTASVNTVGYPISVSQIALSHNSTVICNVAYLAIGRWK